MADATVLVKQAADGDRAIDNEALTVGGQTVYRQRVTIGAVTGVWDYRAGVSGTVTIPAGGRVIGWAVHATTAGSAVINSGQTIPVPANVGIAGNPLGNLIAPTIVFTGTDSYFVEFLT